MGESTYLPFGAEDGEEAAAGAVDEPAAEDDGADYSDIEPEEDEEETDYEPTPEAVSYTHLDVYKRQSIHCKVLTLLCLPSF